MRTKRSVEPTVMTSPSFRRSGVWGATSTLWSRTRELCDYTTKYTNGSAYLFNWVPLVESASIKKTCPLRISTCGSEDYYDEHALQPCNQRTVACVVDISLSLYKLTPFSLNCFPVDLPILNTSSPSCCHSDRTRQRRRRLVCTNSLTSVGSSRNFWPM
jgi:hypothetical protein